MVKNNLFNRKNKAQLIKEQLKEIGNGDSKIIHNE